MKERANPLRSNKGRSPTKGWLPEAVKQNLVIQLSNCKPSEYFIANLFNLKHLNHRPAFRKLRESWCPPQQRQRVFAPAVTEDKIVAGEMLQKLRNPCACIDDRTRDDTSRRECHIQKLIRLGVLYRREGVIDTGSKLQRRIAVHEGREIKPLGVKDARACGETGKNGRVCERTVFSRLHKADGSPCDRGRREDDDRAAERGSALDAGEEGEKPTDREEFAHERFDVLEEIRGKQNKERQQHVDHSVPRKHRS